MSILPRPSNGASRGQKTSKNYITIHQLALACKHVDELVKAGMTFNLACRSLEIFADCYAQQIVLGISAPLSAERVELKYWSREAKKLKQKHPKLITSQSGRFVRVEHGTPRRAFARMILELSQQDLLTEKSAKGLVRRYWKLAVITLSEDRNLNRNGNRFKMSSSPDRRWKKGGIVF